MDDENRYAILVVDDNPAIHEDFKKILMPDEVLTDVEKTEQILFAEKRAAQAPAAPQRLIIDSAYHGEEGLRLIKNKLAAGEHYVMAFIDIRMPAGLDGIKTIGKIWELDPDIQIVICSAYSDYTWQEIANLLGESEKLLVLKKPFDVIEVRQIVTASLKKSILNKEINSRVSHLSDMVEKKSSELATYLSLIKTTLESTTDAIIILDKEKKIVDFNNKFAQSWDLPLGLIKTSKSQAIVDYIKTKVKNPEKVERIFKDPNDQEEAFDLIELLNGNTLECYSKPQYLNNTIIGRAWSFSNITERMELQAKLAYQATHDPLTGLANRYLLSDRLTLAIETAKRSKTLCAIFFIDLDRFKTINDTLGHEIGDQLIREFSNRIKIAVRKTDLITRITTPDFLKEPVEDAEAGNNIIARMGGDEFVIILTNLKDKNPCLAVYSRIKSALEQPIVIGDKSFEITCSVGISLYPLNGYTNTELLKNADIAMYRSKRIGGNQLQFYSNSMNEDIAKRFQLELELKKAIQKNEFILEYQPEIDLQTGKIIAVEALIRWMHPRLGLVPPLSFIPIAEEIGFINSISQWVIKTAAIQAKQLRNKIGASCRIAINLSAHEFRQRDIVAKIEEAINEAGLPPDCLEIELTESIIIENFENVIAKMKQLRDLGIKFVIDDFGTGYSSLSYLSMIPVDKIKIDRSFISMLTETMVNKKDHMIVDAIISIAQKMDIPVIAEGIETAFQYQYLKEHQCTQGQGYYFYHSLPIHELEEILKTNG